MYFPGNLTVQDYHGVYVAPQATGVGMGSGHRLQGTKGGYGHIE